MKSCRPKKFAHTLVTAILSIVCFFMLLGISNAKQPGPPFAFPGGKRGQEAINALRERLPEVASRYGKKRRETEKKLFARQGPLARFCRKPSLSLQL